MSNAVPTRPQSFASDETQSLFVKRHALVVGVRILRPLHCLSRMRPSSTRAGRTLTLVMFLSLLGISGIAAAQAPSEGLEESGSTAPHGQESSEASS
jgi:hypothetical protein